MSFKAAILRDDRPDNSLKWEKACEEAGVEYITVNMLRSDWLDIIAEFSPDFCLCRPPGDVSANKEVFDKKLFFLERDLRYACYPGYSETVIYENKAALSWFLQANKLPHPKTFVSTDLKEIQDFISSAQYPLVAKTLIGAAGSGVKVLVTEKEAINYSNMAFTKGIKRRIGPNRKTGTPTGWLKKAFKSPAYLIKKLKIYSRAAGEVQKNIVLLQEYIEHDYEWRIVRIGNSYFGYKKLKTEGKASGSKQFEYGEVPEELLSFARELCERFDFHFMAIDLFYSNGKIFINELQTIFGHANPYITKVNERPGRYRYENDRWLFEEGMFNANESYSLRLEAVLKRIQAKDG